MKSGRLNISLNFPIISLIGNDVSVFYSLKDYTTCLKSYIPTLNRTKEKILDSAGILYDRKTVKSLGYINPLRGFSLRFGGFGVCYVEKELFLVKEFSNTELIVFGKQILDCNKKNLVEGDVDILGLERELLNSKSTQTSINIIFYIANPTSNSLNKL